MTIASEISRLQTAKADLKTAIEAKGVDVASETLDAYAALVDDISQGVDTSDATAAAGDILSPETAYVNGSKLTGTMTDRGAVTITPSTSNQSIAAGYHNGSGVVYGDADLTAGNIKKDVVIFGVTGTLESGTDTSDADATESDILVGKTAYVNGVKITGIYTNIKRIDLTNVVPAAPSITVGTTVA